MHMQDCLVPQLSENDSKGMPSPFFTLTSVLLNPEYEAGIK